ncbi:MAG: alpha/beta hydrolase [Clostridia bacterium]|nr:alpha/beta hydrolase [Clostridia bacterium]
MQLKLWENDIPYFDPLADTPNQMTTFLLETTEKHPCVVVLPGGGYSGRAKHEGGPIAEFFNSQGFHAVVVDYRVAPNRFPAGLSDVQRAVRILRVNAEEWHVDPERIVTCGFSAGGHLAASSILYSDVYTCTRAADEIDSMPHIPNGAILGYPVISVEAGFGHIGSGRNLLGEAYEAEKESFFLAKHVTGNTPPVYLWHTSDDAGVNVKNSLIFAEALRDHNVPFEMHVFPHGPHGIGLAEDYPDAKQWKTLAADWIRRNV